MPVSVVVGGQYGSEGKGKVALHIAEATKAAAVVRVGGPNSGHTAVDASGKTWVFRQLPAACLAKNTLIFLPAGSLIDVEILKREVAEIGLDSERLIIDPQATLVTDKHKNLERERGLIERIGSTGSGTGAALQDRLSRGHDLRIAENDNYLRRFVRPFTPSLMRNLLNNGERIVIEGTQGFGLSIWHGPAYPHSTSRDTTAANFIAETGLAPHDVDDVVLCVRSFPIRVGGASGPLENEIDWPTLAKEAALPLDHVELTSATKRVRRVARFDAKVVRQAITVNRPHRIVLNHFDYVDPDVRCGQVSARGRDFLARIEASIEQKVDLVGISPSVLIDARSLV